MTDMDQPLSSARGSLWLGVPATDGGRGLELGAQCLTLHVLDGPETLVEWSTVVDIRYAAKESRWRRPTVMSWALNLLAELAWVWSPGLPGDIGVRIDTTTGSLEHRVTAHNAVGYPAAPLRVLDALLELLLRSPAVRPALEHPDRVRSACRRAAGEVAAGADATAALRDRLRSVEL